MPSINLPNEKISYNHPHDVAAIIESYVLDVYHKGLLNTGNTVLDLGAGIGVFAILASRMVGPKGLVIAIEPSPDDYKTLLYNLRVNHCDNVSPINVAVANFNGELSLEFKGKTFKAMCKPLQDILNEENVGRIDFCKMDIEGGEREVIPSSTDIFSNIKYLSMEIHGGYQAELIPFMERLGFRFERITKRSYIKNAFRFALKHPHRAYTLIHLLKQAGEYPGSSRIIKGIEIESSDNLVTGIFSKKLT